MNTKFGLRGCCALLGVLALVQCSQPAPAPEAAAPATNGGQAGARKYIRFTGAGNSYPGFTRVGLMMLGALKRDYPDHDTWIDFHESGRQFRDGVLRVMQGDAEIVFANPAHTPTLAYRGVAVFTKDGPQTGLRGIGKYPSDDWITFAVDPKLGITSVNEIRERKLGLKIGTAYQDGDNIMPFLLREVLRRHGISEADFTSWGGEIISTDYFKQPRGTNVRQAYSNGEINALFLESGYDANWAKNIGIRPMTFINLDPEAAKGLEAEWGWPSRYIRAGYYPGQPERVLALDFTDWALAVHERMSDEMAYKLAQLFIERYPEMEGPPEVKVGMERITAGFGGNKREFVPAEQIKMGIPLHPGAIRYYREKGILPAGTN
ncbi:MAG: hypothetical protein A3F70_18985 [Acidobacteria bacterium RIFCSPLOWO2_12_FULL_67_14]|nr:MAG: hypothetical protein A3F70_18985 [Acidobacteria bacterium RIFCSPLOWO2_12_FULL_67_14]